MKVSTYSIISVGVLNLLETVNVYLNENAAFQFGVEVDYLSHAIFHLFVGLLFIQIGRLLLLERYRMPKITMGFLGLLFLLNGVSILLLQQHAIKFDYSIHYVVHALYYLILGSLMSLLSFQLHRALLINK